MAGELPVFVINLERAADRLVFMTEQAIRAGIEFERVPGNWGCEIEPEAVRAKFIRSDGTLRTRLRPGEIGCYSSHLKTHTLIVERNMPLALVLEDDVELPADFSDMMCEIVAQLPSTWDIVKLCNNPKRAVYSVRRIGARHLVRFSREPSLSGAYLISHTGVMKMLRPDKRLFPFDGELSRPWRFGLDVYGICPAPVRQLHPPSAITAQGGRAKIWKSPWQRIRAWAYAVTNIGMRGLIACRLAETRALLRGDKSVPMIVE